jgi:nitrate reductase / nitrite oxidoreductase, beta subunit
VGRIRYLGLILYDADRITEAALHDDAELVYAQRDILQDPFDPMVIAAAKANGVTDQQIAAAQNSPVFKFVKRWGLALPLHPEFRTLPMLFYVPPMLPVLGRMNETGIYDNSGVEGLGQMISSLEQARIPIKYMASLFTAGNTDIVEEVYRKQIAVRLYKRSQRVKDISPAEAQEAMRIGRTTPEECEAIFNLTSLPTFEERFVIPAMAREEAVEQGALDPYTHKPAAGFGFRETPARRW